MLTRSGDTYSANFGNNLVTNNGFSGTRCNRLAARGVYQNGGKKKKMTIKRLKRKIPRRSFYKLKRRITGGYIHTKKRNNVLSSKLKKLKRRNNTVREKNKKYNYTMRGGMKPLDFAKLQNNNNNVPKIAKGTSSHYEILMDSGKGGLMSNPPSIKKVIKN